MRSTAIIAIVIAGLAGCRQPSSESTADAPIEALRFSHEQHSEQACTRCHAAGAVRQGRIERPGHGACNAVECHGAVFAPAKDKTQTAMMCGLCHEGIPEPGSHDALLVPYPPEVGSRSLPANFSHKAHLNAERIEKLLGFHLSCTDCHRLRASGDILSEGGTALLAPDHKACARCHAPEAAPTGTPTMLECTGCHQDQRREVSRQRSFIVGDLIFGHSAHRSDRKGRLIVCTECHAASLDAERRDIGRHQPTPMRVCVGCHDDSSKVPKERRMRSCGTCHTTRTGNLSALAPRSHMPATERPANHTRAFRRDHESDARADAVECARCHTMLSGNQRDTCDECHQVMQPSDHVVSWREFDHGPEAATDPDRCVTCHVVDFCVTCHQERPRSHYPLIEFRQDGHGTQAVLNLRACITCHQPARDCTGSGCHRSDQL